MRRTLTAFAFLLCLSNLYGQVTSNPAVIDATKFNFRDNHFKLDGTWLWFDNHLLSPAEVSKSTGYPVEFPGIWNERRSNESGQGYATYAVTVLVPPTTNEFAIDIPQIYSSFILFANGKEVARNGTPSQTRQSMIPQWRPEVISIDNVRDTLKLTLQISNFHHNKGGCKDSIVLGSKSMLIQKSFISMTAKAVQSAVLLMLALGFIMVWIRNSRKSAVIWFSLTCITWAVRSLFSNDYLFISFFPDFSWETMIRIEYITLYLTMIWSVLFLHELFRNEGSQLMKYIMIAANGGYIVYTLIIDPIEFTKLLPLYLGTAGVLLIYGAGVVLMALVNERKGAVWLTVSVALGLLIFSYDIFTYEGWFSYNPILFSAAYVIIFMMMGAALLLHLGVVKSTSTASATLTYKDLYGDDN